MTPERLEEIRRSANHGPLRLGELLAYCDELRAELNQQYEYAENAYAELWAERNGLQAIVSWWSRISAQKDQALRKLQKSVCQWWCSRHHTLATSHHPDCEDARAALSPSLSEPQEQARRCWHASPPCPRCAARETDLARDAPPATPVQRRYTR